jgi:rod shape-determining protein MreD
MMSYLSYHARKRVGEIAATAFIICFIWLIQLTLLSNFALKDVVASLPLTFTIVWGSIFGSTVQPLSPDELRNSSFKQVFARQAQAGSLSGALVGAFFGALYSSVLPVYPICYPLIGWIAGYFCLHNLNQATFLCLPLVFISTIFSESVMAIQLATMHRPDIMQHLAQFAFTEAAFNALIAPFIFFPMQGWYYFYRARASTSAV